MVDLHVVTMAVGVGVGVGAEEEEAKLVHGCNASLLVPHHGGPEGRRGREPEHVEGRGFVV